MSNTTNTRKVFYIIVFIALLFILVGCNDDINNPVYVVEQTITVTSDMISNTVVDGCGAFNPCN